MKGLRVEGQSVMERELQMLKFLLPLIHSVTMTRVSEVNSVIIAIIKSSKKQKWERKPLWLVD